MFFGGATHSVLQVAEIYLSHFLFTNCYLISCLDLQNLDQLHANLLQSLHLNTKINQEEKEEEEEEEKEQEEEEEEQEQNVRTPFQKVGI